MRRILPALWIIGILLSHLLLLSITRFTLWPEMLVYPYLLNHGFLLYRDIISPYPPLLINLLSIFTKQFSYDVLPIQILTWSTIFVIDILIFALTLQITKNRSLAFASIIFFVVFSVPFGANGIWFDLFQTPPILLAVYFYYNYLQNNKNQKSLIFAFCLLALAFSIKQQAVWLIIWFALLGMLSLKKLKKNVFRFLLLTLVPSTIIVIGLTVIFLSQDIIGDFLLWTVYFPFFKSSTLPGYILIPDAKQLLVLTVLALIFSPSISSKRGPRLPAVGEASDNSAKRESEDHGLRPWESILRKNLRELFLVLTGFVLFIFAYPRFDYFHLIPSLSVLSLAFGKNIQYLARSNLRIKFISISAILLLTIFSIRFFQKNWTTEIRFFEDKIYQTAKFMQIINPSNQPVFLQNVSGQLLVISGSLPTKPWADSFPWYLEIPGIQQDVVDGISKDNPLFIIYKPYQNTGKFNLASYRPKKIADYLDQNYEESFRINDELFLRSKITR